MIQVLHSIFQLDGTEYIANESFILTSSPPQYNCYRLSDGKHRYVFCAQVRSSFIRYSKPEDERWFSSVGYSNYSSASADNLIANNGDGSGNVVFGIARSGISQEDAMKNSETANNMRVCTMELRYALVDGKEQLQQKWLVAGKDKWISVPIVS